MYHSLTQQSVYIVEYSPMNWNYAILLFIYLFIVFFTVYSLSLYVIKVVTAHYVTNILSSAFSKVSSLTTLKTICICFPCGWFFFRFAKKCFAVFDLSLYGFKSLHAPPSLARLTTGHTFRPRHLHVSTFCTNHFILTGFDSNWSPVMNPTQCGVTASQELAAHRTGYQGFRSPTSGTLQVQDALMIFVLFPTVVSLQLFDSLRPG